MFAARRQPASHLNDYKQTNVHLAGSMSHLIACLLACLPSTYSTIRNLTAFGVDPNSEPDYSPRDSSTDTTGNVNVLSVLKLSDALLFDKDNTNENTSFCPHSTHRVYISIEKNIFGKYGQLRRLWCHR